MDLLQEKLCIDRLHHCYCVSHKRNGDIAHSTSSQWLYAHDTSSHGSCSAEVRRLVQTLYNTCQHRDILLVSSEKGNSFRTQINEAVDQPSSVVYILPAQGLDSYRHSARSSTVRLVLFMIRRKISWFCPTVISHKWQIRTKFGLRTLGRWVRLVSFGWDKPVWC